MFDANIKREVCGAGERKSQLVRYSLAMKERFVIVEHVPAEVCDRCGETTFSPEVVERLQQTLWQARRPSGVLETPVYEFA